MRAWYVAVLVTSLAVACGGDDDVAGQDGESVSATSTPAPPNATSSGDLKVPTSSPDVDPTGPESSSPTPTGPDGDNDGVPDQIDNCPEDENADQLDVCTPVPPNGGCVATLFIARPAELSEPVLVVRFSTGAVGSEPSDGATAASCDEGNPRLDQPPPWPAITISATEDAIYVLATNDLAGQPGGGLDLSGADFDSTALAAQTVLADDEIERVLIASLTGAVAPVVAAAVTPAAEATLPAEVWEHAMTLNPDLGQLVVEQAPPASG